MSHIEIFRDSDCKDLFIKLVEETDAASEAFDSLFGHESFNDIASQIAQRIHVQEDNLKSYLTNDAIEIVERLIAHDELVDSVSQAVARLEWYNTVPYRLYEAYMGTYEDDPEAVGFSKTLTTSYCLEKMRDDAPEDILDTYLTWNGMIGYADVILEVIAFTEGQ